MNQSGSDKTITVIRVAVVMAIAIIISIVLVRSASTDDGADDRAAPSQVVSLLDRFLRRPTAGEEPKSGLRRMQARTVEAGTRDSEQIDEPTRNKSELSLADNSHDDFVSTPPALVAENDIIGHNGFREAPQGSDPAEVPVANVPVAKLTILTDEQVPAADINQDSVASDVPTESTGLTSAESTAKTTVITETPAIVETASQSKASNTAPADTSATEVAGQDSPTGNTLAKVSQTETGAKTDQLEPTRQNLPQSLIRKMLAVDSRIVSKPADEVLQKPDAKMRPEAAKSGRTSAPTPSTEQVAANSSPPATAATRPNANRPSRLANSSPSPPLPPLPPLPKQVAMGPPNVPSAQSATRPAIEHVAEAAQRPARTVAPPSPSPRRPAVAKPIAEVAQSVLSRGPDSETLAQSSAPQKADHVRRNLPPQTAKAPMLTAMAQPSRQPNLPGRVPVTQPPATPRLAPIDSAPAARRSYDRQERSTDLRLAERTTPSPQAPRQKSGAESNTQEPTSSAVASQPIAPTNSRPVRSWTVFRPHAEPALSPIREPASHLVATAPATDKTVAEQWIRSQQQVRRPAKVSNEIGALAEKHNKYARGLAMKGAVFAAEDEYIQAMRMIAQARDAVHRSETHRQALAEALIAFEEADDFAAALATATTDSDVKRYISAHRTPALKQVAQERIPALNALQTYYSFAANRLSMAVGNEPVASVALCGLAQLQTLQDSTVYPERTMGAAKAIVLFQISLSVDAANSLAANELGVMYTRYGRLEQARDAFLQSTLVSNRAEPWANLSKIYERLGNRQLSQQATAQYQAIQHANQHQNTEVAGVQVRWVNHDAFGGPAENINTSVAAKAQPTPQPPAQVRTPTATKDSGGIKKNGGLRSILETLRGRPQIDGRGRAYTANATSRNSRHPSAKR